MKKSFLSLAALLITTFIFAQQQYTVKGTLKMTDGHLPAVNVLILQANDSTFIKGSFFLDGQFEIDHLENENILVEFSSLEFTPFTVPVNFAAQPTIDLGVLEVKTAGLGLEEITVKAKRPTYIQRVDGTTEVLIENTLLAASNSVTEILSKSPDVLINEEGNISIFGKGNAIIYLNGKRIIANQLSLITPSNIKKIEIIRNPSAKFDAEGAAVINIITHHSINDNLQVKLNQNISYSNFAGLDTYSEVNIGAKMGKFATHATYSLLQGKDRHILSTTRNRDAEAVFLRTALTTEWKNDMEAFNNYGLGLQFNHTKNSYFSLEYSGFSENLGGSQLSNNIIEDKESLNFYDSTIERDETDNSNSLSFNYQQTLDSTASLFIGGQYSKFANTADNAIIENRIEPDFTSTRALQNLRKLNVNISSIQTDFTKTLHNKNTLELGAKYSDISNNSQFDFLTMNDGNNFIIDPSLSNQFNYQESIIAAYAQLNGQLNKRINFSAGLRAEHTNYQLELSQINNQLIKDKYLNIFPRIAANVQISKQYQIGISYTSGINRVPYQRLNPVLIYQDPYTSIQGNPASVPEKTHNFELNNKLAKTNIRFGYTHTIDPFGGGALRGEDDKSYVLIRLNFAKKHEFYTSVSRTFESSWLTSTNTLNLRYTNIIDNEFSFENTGSKPNVYMYSDNTIPVGNLFKINLLFWYLGDEDEGLYQRKSSWNLTLSLNKSFFDNTLQCRLIANDIFHSVRAAGDYSVGETDIYFHRRWNTNYMRLAINYNFGASKKSTFKNKAVGRSEGARVR